MGRVEVENWSCCPEISMDNTRWEYVIKNLKDHPIQSFSYIEQNQIYSRFTIITSLHHKYITLHAYTHTYTLCSNFDGLSILHQGNKGSRSFLFKIRIYPRIQLNMKAFPKKGHIQESFKSNNLLLHPLLLIINFFSSASSIRIGSTSTTDHVQKVVDIPSTHLIKSDLFLILLNTKLEQS